jgi:hypothetical protein
MRDAFFHPRDWMDKISSQQLSRAADRMVKRTEETWRVSAVSRSGMENGTDR